MQFFGWPITSPFSWPIKIAMAERSAKRQQVQGMLDEMDLLSFVSMTILASSKTLLDGETLLMQLNAKICR